MALCLSGLFLYFPAMILPLMTFQTFGMSESANIIDSIVNYYRQGYFLVSLMVVFSAVIFPFLKLSIGFLLTTLIKLQTHPPLLPRLFRLYLHLEEWAMIEVYLLGIMVTVFKMYHTTEITYNIGFYCFISLVLVTMGTTAVLDKKIFWQQIKVHTNQFGLEFGKRRPSLLLDQKYGGASALEADLISCDICSQLIAPPAIRCPLCGAGLHMRKPYSISRTWALILTAGLLFIPANTLPIMRVDYLGVPDNSTILDGILHFFKDGSYGVGLIILCASILVPLFKITGLLIILLTIKFRRGDFLLQKAKMFRFIEFIGRWSMLDIFVIALLSVLVQFGFFSSIQPAPAVTYFCLVVITTMLATLAFDPRLLWDNCYQKSLDVLNSN